MTDSRVNAGTQTVIHRWVANIGQARRMFGHHRNDSNPEEPSKQVGAEASDAEFEEELAELGRKVDDI